MEDPQGQLKCNGDDWIPLNIEGYISQVNEAINILTRRSCEDIKLHHSKKRILKLLVKQYLEKCERCNSAPLEVMRSNAYFMDFLNSRVVENKRL
jgi:putative transposase